MPYVEAHTPLNIGDRFTIRGVNLDLLDPESVLLLDEASIDTTGALYYMVLVDFGSDFAVFEVQVDAIFSLNHSWNKIASPVNPPRTETDFVLL